MKNKLMLGLWRFIINVPPSMWQKQITKGKRKFEKVYGTLSPKTRMVHHCAVGELPAAGGPLPPEVIAEKVGLPVSRVREDLDYLEKQIKFLYRNREGAVTWAYPFTVEKTPHSLIFDTGERVYAA